MFRYIIILGTFLLALLLYIDRICISVAKGPIVGDLNLTDTQMGWVLSGFALGYALLQASAGRLVDQLGPRRVLAGIVTFWSALTALTGLCWNFVSLLVVRFLFGAGEAGAFPGMARATFSWIPMQERGVVTGINFSGSRLGAAFALPAVAWLIQVQGWRLAFAVLGGIGLIWAVAWWLVFRDEPEQHSALSEPERDFIRANRPAVAPGTTAKPLGHYLKDPNVRLAMAQYFCSNFTFFFALTWLYPHLQEKYNLSAVDTGWWASAPLLAGAVGNWFAGWWIDRLYRRSSLRRSRLIPAVTGFGLSAIGLLFSVGQTEVGGAIFFLSIAIFGADMTLPPSWAFCVDIGKINAGMVSGTMNMAGNIGSFLTSLAFPYLKTWTGSVTPFFFLGAALNVLAIFFWLRKHFYDHQPHLTAI
ncbi:MFS transporter [Nibrella viscosa]|uniref:MFS transporter n=1 Tax=Nibrella viscosa TaxID=1084524 RepID=A0ABP8K2U7_9BACT